MRIHDLEKLIQRCVGSDVAKKVTISAEGVVITPSALKLITQDIYQLIKKYFPKASLVQKGEFSEINLHESLQVAATLNAKYRLTFKE